MLWKKLLETNELIAYEKASSDIKVRIEARNRKNGWVVYKTYNFKDGEGWVSHVKEYTAKTREEIKYLLKELKKENDISLNEISQTGRLQIELKRCYKEDFVEKWRFKIDDFNDDNFLVVLYDSEIQFDVIMHDRYNNNEKEIINKLIDALGLKDISSKIRYNIFYFKKHSAKRRVYEKDDKEIVAKVEFNIDPKV